MEQMNNKQQYTTMRKRFITLLLAVFVAVGPALAQVFIMEDDDAMNVRDPEGSIVFNVMVSPQDSNTEQFIPLGEGLLMLSGLAGAYLLRKRKHD